MKQKKLKAVLFTLISALLIAALAAGCASGGVKKEEASSSPSPETEAPATESPESPSPESGWTLDEAALTDDYLLSLVKTPEIAMTGEEGFTFSSPSELGSEELYTAFLIFTDASELEKCKDSEGLFRFGEETVRATLDRFFKGYSFDIASVSGYDAASGEIVTPMASGFGGERFMKIASKGLNGNTATFTADFYDESDSEVMLTKEYAIEFYEGGYYYLSAKVTAETAYSWISGHLRLGQIDEEFNIVEALHAFGGYLDGKPEGLSVSFPGDYEYCTLRRTGEWADISLSLTYIDKMGLGWNDELYLAENGEALLGGQSMEFRNECYSLGDFGDFILIARGEETGCPLELCEEVYWLTGLYFYDELSGEETCLIEPKIMFTQYGWTDWNEEAGTVTIQYIDAEAHSDASQLVTGTLDVSSKTYTELSRVDRPNN